MTEHEELINRLSDDAADLGDNTPAAADDELVIPVRVRRAAQESLQQGAQALDDAAASMEAPYSAAPAYTSAADELPMPTSYAAEATEARPAKRLNFRLPPQYRRTGRVLPSAETDEEKWWAAAAHAASLVTIVVGLVTGGLGALLTVFVPLAIFAAYREKSEYIARHALQAFAAQVVGFGGFVMFGVVFGTLWGVLLLISGLLILLLVGIILFPLVLIAGLLVLFASLALPFGTLVYSMIATVEALNGNSYSYPWIGDWVDDQLYGYLDD